MARHLVPFEFISLRWLDWIELVLASPVVLWGAWPLLEQLCASVAFVRLNMWTLIGLGAGAAYAFSVIATVPPSVFRDALRSPQGEVVAYFEAAVISAEIGSADTGTLRTLEATKAIRREPSPACALVIGHVCHDASGGGIKVIAVTPV